MALAGIGRKSTDVILNFDFREPTIAVDTRVHRVVNRPGMVETTSSEAAAERLDQITPPEYKQHAHEWLVQHGMDICKARAPRCRECALASYCDYYQDK